MKRCQHCRKGFEQNSPGNLMVGKFDENTYSKRHGEGRGRRNFCFHIDKGCITPIYNSVTWDNLNIMDCVKQKLNDDQKRHLSSMGMKVSN